MASAEIKSCLTGIQAVPVRYRDRRTVAEIRRGSEIVRKEESRAVAG